MKRWRRRLVLLLGLAAAWWILRIGWSLWPPSWPAWPEWHAMTGVTVINPGRDRRVDQTLLIRAGRIESIRDRSPEQRLLPRARLFENHYVLPGLIDLDVHGLPSNPTLQRMFAVLFLMRGVTTVRDTGNFDGSIGELQRRIQAGELPWPRLLACGRVLEGNPPRCAQSRGVRDADDARHAVDELAAMGAWCVAVSWTLAPEVLAAVEAAATARGLPVIGDVPAGVRVDGAHLGEARLLSALPPAPPGRRPADWIRAWQSSRPADVDALVRASASPRTAYIPNLWRWSQLARLDDPGLRDLTVSMLPRFYRELIWEPAVADLMGTATTNAPAGSGSVGALTPADIGQAVAVMQQAVHRLHEAGVRIHVGSGTPSPFVVPGWSMWFEMHNLVAAGLTPEEAWVAATREAGEALGIPLLGTLVDGAPADLLIFREDPTRDLAALMSLEAVVSQGRLYSTRRLNGYVLEYARYFERAVYDRLSMLWVRFKLWWTGDDAARCIS